MQGQFLNTYQQIEKVEYVFLSPLNVHIFYMTLLQLSCSIFLKQLLKKLDLSDFH